MLYDAKGDPIRSEVRSLTGITVETCLEDETQYWPMGSHVLPRRRVLTANGSPYRVPAGETVGFRVQSYGDLGPL